MINALISIVQDETGTAIIDYGFLAALVAIAAIGGLTALGNSVENVYTTVSTAFTSVVGVAP